MLKETYIFSSRTGASLESQQCKRVHPTRVPTYFAPFFIFACRWFSKQFVEVSASYLKACGATVYFVETPQTHVPTAFGTHPSKDHWQEMDADMPEGYLLEGL